MSTRLTSLFDPMPAWLVSVALPSNQSTPFNSATTKLPLQSDDNVTIGRPPRHVEPPDAEHPHGQLKKNPQLSSKRYPCACKTPREVGYIQPRSTLAWCDESMGHSTSINVVDGALEIRANRTTDHFTPARCSEKGWVLSPRPTGHEPFVFQLAPGPL